MEIGHQGIQWHSPLCRNNHLYKEVLGNIMFGRITSSVLEKKKKKYQLFEQLECYFNLTGRECLTGTCVLCDH